MALRLVAGQPTILVSSDGRLLQQVCSKLGQMPPEAWLEVPSASMVNPGKAHMPQGCRVLGYGHQRCSLYMRASSHSMR